MGWNMKLLRFFETILKFLGHNQDQSLNYKTLEMKKNCNLEERVLLQKLFNENS